MELAELKPLLAALVLPPAGPLLLAAFGLLALRRPAGRALALASGALLWLLSCNAVAVALSHTLLPQFAPLAARALAASPVQAIVVLGGGIEAEAPEYGEAQPSAATAARVRYGVWLARQSQRPLAFAGGVGWSQAGTAAPAEGAVVRRALEQDGGPGGGVALRWVDERSRDTAGNAAQMKALLQRDGVERIALVTHAWHMPRALRDFERAGFQVTPAPMGYITPQERPLLEWLPSAQGLRSSRLVLREWLGAWATRW
jgi:uncharacterized SAM-binding protein YcdF (DUF218 family)